MTPARLYSRDARLSPAHLPPYVKSMFFVSFNLQQTVKRLNLEDFSLFSLNSIFSTRISL